MLSSKKLILDYFLDNILYISKKSEFKKYYNIQKKKRKQKISLVQVNDLSKLGIYKILLYYFY